MNPPTDRERPALSEAPSIHDEAHLRYDKMTMRNAFIAGAKWARETSPKPALTQGGVVKLIERLNTLTDYAEGPYPRGFTDLCVKVMQEAATALERLAVEDKCPNPNGCPYCDEFGCPRTGAPSE